MNLRANFDKNKKVSRIKALREFTMKRLTDFFGEKGWKTGKMGYNENRKRSKYCCWTVPMSDWNNTATNNTATNNNNKLNRTYEWLKLAIFARNRSVEHNLSWTVPMSDWNRSPQTAKMANPRSWTVPMSDWNTLSNLLPQPLIQRIVEPYLWVIETRTRFRFAFEILKSWTVPMSDWNQIGIPVDAGLLFGLNRTYEWYVAFAELIVLYEYYELFR